MTSSVSLGCLVFLCLVMQSLSLCVFRNGSCTNSSLVLMSQSQLEENDGLSLTIKELPFISTKCSTTNEENDVSIFMGKILLDYEITNSNDTMMKVQIPGNTTTGLKIISFSFQISDPKCYNVVVIMNHEITLKVIGDPNISDTLVGSSSHLIQCAISPLISVYSAWIVFKLNGKEIGYCSCYTISPVEYKNDLSIYYDDDIGLCTLKIEKITSKNEGNYSCSVIIPQDHEYITINSSNTDTTKKKKKTNYTVIGLPIGGLVTVIIVFNVLLYSYCIYKRCGQDCRGCNYMYQRIT